MRYGPSDRRMAITGVLLAVGMIWLWWSAPH